jgi:hypothetical protein
MGAYELKMAEYNIAPYFTFSQRGTDILLASPYRVFYSTEYEVWLNDAVAMYNRLYDMSKAVRFGRITGHRVYDTGVRVTEYTNPDGSKVNVYVNYSQIPHIVDGHTIAPMSYVHR